ncbi:competence protein F [Candidatus Omnitrophus magneticus]|uniref:Competence protein F n=1 Tax=Candidatus Omnitrophus magneticus TaxID=1609969 RepID=A0A0F0CUN8_9BACT|nr:competence protein F [Candidatus Omnitrophus magneticus]
MRKNIFFRGYALFGKVTAAFLNMLFPEYCLHCSENFTTVEFPLCDKCMEKILKEAPPFISASRFIDSVFSCRVYQDVIRTCVREFKYKNSVKLLPVFEIIIKDYLSKKNGRLIHFDMLVPIPLSKFKYNQRRYNQSEIIAGIVNRILKIPVLKDNLVRVKDNPSQITMDVSGRKKNAENLFKARQPDIFKGKVILVIDDVITTGATLNSCARELLKSGAKSVSAFTFAKTLQ